MKSFFLASNFWANEPFGSLKANERKDTEPSLYEGEAFTYKGHWVTVSVAQEGLSFISAIWHALGEWAFMFEVVPTLEKLKAILM